MIRATATCVNAAVALTTLHWRCKVAAYDPTIFPAKPVYRTFQDLEGRRIGRLIVVTYIGNVRNYASWLCYCDCGRWRVVAAGKLLRGRTKSCGCLQADAACKTKFIHGQSGTHMYRLWQALKSRCLSPSGKYYHNYGGRGITVCDRWRESFEHFLEDVGPRPSEDYTLDRIDNDGNYEPGNCRWATWSEQCRNKRTNLNLTFNGETMCITDWARRIGVSVECLKYRIKMGWPVDSIISRKKMVARALDEAGIV